MGLKRGSYARPRGLICLNIVIIQLTKLKLKLRVFSSMSCGDTNPPSQKRGSTLAITDSL